MSKQARRIRAKHTGMECSMTEGPIFSNMLQFFVPIMLGTLLQQLYATVDTLILGRWVGKTALAAVGGSDAVLIKLIVGFFVGLSSGASIIIAQYYGAGDRNRVRDSVHTAMGLALIVGVIMTAAGMLLLPSLLTALDTPPDTMQYSIDYLRWYSVGMVPAMIYNIGSGILRSVGDSRRPLYFLLACTIANVLLDLLLVAVLKMEVAGAAIATSLSQMLCALLVLRTLTRRTDACRLGLKNIRITPPLFRRMIAIGLPTGLQNTLYSITNLLVHKAINRLGTDTVAAWSIFFKLDGIYWPIGAAIGIAVMSFVGQNYGARKRDRIQSSMRAGLLMHLATSAVFSVLFITTGGFTVRLFSDDPTVVAQGMEIVRSIGPFYPLIACTEIMSATMRGVGNTKSPTMLTLFGVCVLRLVILFTLTFPHLSNFTIVLCYPPTWAVSSLLFALYYKFGRWMPTD